MEKKTQLLLVDDDKEIGILLSDWLQRYGFQVAIAYEGEGLIQRLSEQSFDLLLLDLRLPGEDGLSLCRRIRQHSTLPIIILTANGDETDCILGLEMGADDYVAKPFNPRELVARIKAVLRRTQLHHAKPLAPVQLSNEMYTLEFAGWRLDSASRLLRSPQGEPTELSAGEFSLLSLFLSRPNRVLSREQLLALLHHKHHDPFDRSIDIQVSRLRQKLEDNPREPHIIKTVRGGGYLFVPLIHRIEQAIDLPV